jgi:hypothetical protein
MEWKSVVSQVYRRECKQRKNMEGKSVVRKNRGRGKDEVRYFNEGI